MNLDGFVAGAALLLAIGAWVRILYINAELRRARSHIAELSIKPKSTRHPHADIDLIGLKDSPDDKVVGFLENGGFVIKDKKGNYRRTDDR